MHDEDGLEKYGFKFERSSLQINAMYMPIRIRGRFVAENSIFGFGGSHFFEIHTMDERAEYDKEYAAQLLIKDFIRKKLEY